MAAAAARADMKCRFRVEGNCSDQGVEAAKLIKNAANLFFKSEEKEKVEKVSGQRKG